jgi:hypothetical protein
MRLPIFPLVITKQSFQTWCDELAEQGRLFHFEDDPAEIEDKDGDLIFSHSEVCEIEDFFMKVYAQDFDPMECCLEAFKKVNK